MTTYNADQLNPPDNTAPEPVPAPTPDERAAALTGVVGTAMPDLTDTEREADYQAAQSRAEPEVIEADTAQTSDAVAVVGKDTGNVVGLSDRFDVTTTGEAWPHDKLEFKGDLLGIRLPTRQALAAFSLASSKYVSLGVKNDLTGLFIARHLSPESYGRVFSRLMNPDETDYGVETVGALFNAIVTAAVEDDSPDDDG